MPKLKITLKELGIILDDLIKEDGLDCTQGICWSCGATKDYCEPDAEDYKCEECGEFNVQGILNCAMSVI